jgi:DNA repair exonuclease SbcCD ATPase subunit
MWIERLEIQGFRALTGSFVFSPRLNLVVGDNEAGKSTLYDALIRSMYGFTGSERRRSRGRSVRDDCRPWDGRPFGLVAIVRDAGGRDYRIEWDFDSHGARLLEGGVDRSATIQLRGDDVALGELLLGTGLDDFRQVCCLDQEALETVRQSPSLAVALQEAVAQIGGDVAAEEVIERLEAFLRERVGVRVDTLAPTPRGRITALLREQAEVMAALEEERHLREQMGELARSLELNRDEYREMTTKIERTRQRLLLSERDELARKLEQAQRLEAGASQRVDVPALPSQQVIDEIHAGHVRLGQLADATETAERELSQVADEVESVEARERELDARLLELDSYADMDDSARDRVQRIWGELDGLQQATLPEPEALPQADPLLASYRTERQALYVLQAGRLRWTVRRVSWVALVVLSLGVALLVRKLVRRIRGTSVSADEFEQRLSHYGASSLADLDERAANEDRQIAAARARAELARAQTTANEQRIAKLEGQLTDTLDAAGAASATTTEVRVTAYLQACERHTERVAAALELERVRNRLQQLRRPKQQLRGHQSERDTLTQQIRELYAQASIDAEDLSKGEQALGTLLSDAGLAAQTNQDADAAGQALKTLLDGSTVTDLAAQVSKAERGLDEHVAQFGKLASDGGDKAVLQPEMAELQQEAEDTRDRVTELQTRLSDLEQEIGRAAELEERAAELRTKIARLEQAKEAIRVAREVLREAADELHRQFQPHLRGALTKNLPRITGGRYQEAEIDNELRVQVVAPGVGRQVSVEQLSRATKDQIFLVERLEIARLLTPTKGSAPLLLDDPFAHYDAKRLRFGLTLLREAAEERQVIIFSEDADLPALATELCGDCNVVELPAPAARTTTSVGGP